MSIQLYSSPMKYKDPNTGNYTNIIGISGNPGRGIASVELNNDYTLTLTFTDGTSTTTPSIRGNGIESIEKTSTSGLIDTYTITDSDSNTYTFEVTNGDVPNLTIGTVTEGEEASATITGSRENPILNLVLPLPSLTNYVKKTDYANGTNTGVIRVNNNYGLTNVDASDGGVGRTTYTAIMAPTTTEIRTGADRYKPIVPRNQHEASFYGLAKAAGDTTQAQSSNAVGTYTASAKAAIQAMLDVPSNAAMQQAIDNINTMKIHICTSEEYDAQTGVPTVQNPDAQTFYLVPGGESSNLFIEWVYVDNAWERFGSANIDLSGYATKTDTVLDTTLSRDRKNNTTVGNASIAFGNLVEASGHYSQAVGSGATASGVASHAEGLATTASGTAAHAEGWIANASGDYSHAEGRNTTSSGEYSHAEGHNTTASNSHTHAEGNGTVASGLSAHAEGSGAKAQGNFSHAEGKGTIANGASSHVSGTYNVEDSYAAWPEWVASTSYEVGDKVKVTVTENNETIVTGYKCRTANNDASFTASKWIKDVSMNYAEIVGNGTSLSTRSNAYTLDWDGNGHYMGDVYVGANTDSSGGTKVATVDDIAAIEVPVNDVQANGVSVVENGVANVPLATNTSVGLVSGASGNYGIVIGTNGNLKGQLLTNEALQNDAKTGLNHYKPIVPAIQHAATFYGLAKAAGDTTQASSANAVGTYTEEAKAAIQSMLGVSDLLAPRETSYIASQAYAVGDIFTLNGKLYKVTTAIAESGAIVVQDDGETVSGANAVQCKLGEETIKDVQVNGASVVSSGIANVPVGSQNSFGVVKGYGLRGIGVDSGGNIYVMPAGNNSIKQSGSAYAVITTANNYAAAFYGLAKAAGDTTQSSSSNAVGTYTDNAKAAIKRMLGITQTLTVTAQTQDGVTVTGQTVTVRADDAAGEVYATAAYEGQPVSFSLPNGFQYYVSVSDTLDHHFNPTTAQGIITDTDIAVTLTYSDFSTIRTATDIKAALNVDMDLTDLVGEQITCAKSGETLTWDVVDYDSTNKRITLLLHSAFGTANMVFEPAQALMWCETGLAAGAYTFKWNSTQVYFTLTTAIPSGGQLRASNTSFWTYESQSATATLETGTVSTEEISGATDLGKTGEGLLNHHDRVSYGSNNFAESALLWWLNSDAAANTQRVPVTKFSRAHSYSQPGFLNGLDADFIAALDDTEWLCACNNVYECPESLGGCTKGKGQTYTVTSKIGLASEMEIFGSYGGNQDGSTIYDLYNGAENTDRIKYRGTSAQAWWLRSPHWSFASSEGVVSSSGGASYSYAFSSCAVVPAVRISKD